jgi:hypothetical protein
MALGFLLDENLRGPFRRAVAHHNRKSIDPLDVCCVGDPLDLPLGSMDADILRWAEANGRVLVSLDKKTLPPCLAQHLQAGFHVPGLFMIRTSATFPGVVAFLALAAYASDPHDWRDQLVYIP